MGERRQFGEEQVRLLFPSPTPCHCSPWIQLPLLPKAQVKEVARKILSLMSLIGERSKAGLSVKNSQSSSIHQFEAGSGGGISGPKGVP